MNFMDTLMKPKRLVSDLKDLDGVTNNNDAILIFDEGTETILICEDSEDYNRIPFCSEITELSEDNISGLNKLGFEFKIEYIENNWNRV